MQLLIIKIVMSERIRRIQSSGQTGRRAIRHVRCSANMASLGNAREERGERLIDAYDSERAVPVKREESSNKAADNAYWGRSIRLFLWQTKITYCAA